MKNNKYFGGQGFHLHLEKNQIKKKYNHLTFTFASVCNCTLLIFIYKQDALIQYITIIND